MSVLDRSWEERVKHTKRLHLSLTKAIYHPILEEIASLAYSLVCTEHLLVELQLRQSIFSMKKFGSYARSVVQII